MKLILHTDGAAKGNPGPSGIGVVLYRDGEESGEPVAAIGEYIGETTNNVAEYKALLRGLNEALLRGADRIEVRTDSELMTRQIQGRYKVNSPQLIPLHAEAVRLLSKFEQAKIVHVLRGKNALADKLANQGVAARKEKPAAKAKEKTPLAKGAPAPAVPSSPASATHSPFAHTHSNTEDGETQIWNVERLWVLAQSLPIKSVPLTNFDSILDENCWFGDRPATIRDVAKHARRIYEADFSKPIILAASGRLMDGGHRIARAWLEGRTMVDAVQFITDPEPDERRQK